MVVRDSQGAGDETDMNERLIIINNEDKITGKLEVELVSELGRVSDRHSRKSLSCTGASVLNV